MGDVAEGQSGGAWGGADGLMDAARRRSTQVCSLRTIKE